MLISKPYCLGKPDIGSGFLHPRLGVVVIGH